MKMESTSLLDAFRQTTFQLSHHGIRNVQVLKNALEFVDGQLESDYYGHGEIIQDFQGKIAQYLGKKGAVFFPSGTMAQQIALRIWCDRKDLYKVAYHPLCHLEIHEEDGLKVLHHIQPILLADKHRLIQLDDILTMDEDISCLLLELPQREIGGQLPSYEALKSISEYCRQQGIKLHLDGARLFEVLPYYQKTATEVCSLFDSVYVSFYKGIGGVAGAILAGDQDFISESIVWKRRHGGDLISLYPYIISANYYFDDRIEKMQQYYQRAKELTAMFNECHGVSTTPSEPVSNMFHVYFDYSKEKVETVLVEIYEETGVGFTANLQNDGDTKCYFAVTIGDRYEQIPPSVLKTALDSLSAKLIALQ